MKKNEPKSSDDATTITDDREPYESPRIEVEELFEVLALSCGKIQPSSFNCIRVPRLS